MPPVPVRLAGLDGDTAGLADERHSGFHQRRFAVTLFIYVIAANARVFDQLVAEQLPAAVQPRADGPDRAVDELRDLLVSKSFDVAEDHDRPEILRQRFDGFREIVIQKIAVKTRLHVVRIGIFRANGVVEILDVLVIDFIRLFRLLTVDVDVGVLHNPEKPRLAVRAWLKLIPETVRLHVGLLEEIVRVVGIAGHAEREIIERVDVRHRLALEVAMAVPDSFFV